jgi:hypothetical protein
MDGLICIRILRPDGEPIEIERWQQLIENDPELTAIEFVEGVNPRTHERVRVPYKQPAAVWSAHPEGYTNSPFVFAYEDGQITAVCIDRPFATKGAEIARQLNATILETLD